MSSAAKKEWWHDLNLDYSGENNFASFFPSDGNIHTYPAKAVPDMVHSLLLKLKETYNLNKVLDPFLGSGTVALESKYLGLDFYGSDLNPLSILLARTKALTVADVSSVEARLTEFIEKMENKYPSSLIVMENFFQIEYWFKTENIKELSFIKKEISDFLLTCNNIDKETFALMLLTAFSSTVRSSSLTRNGEFKLYRMSPTDMNRFNVNSITIFKEKVLSLLGMLVTVNKVYKKDTILDIKLKNAKDLSHLRGKNIDLILTSPPYGDSQSTVAYGQFSRLSVQWLQDLMEKYLDINIVAQNVDEYLLGGKKSSNITSLRRILRRSVTLRKLLSDMLKHSREEKIKLKQLREWLLDLQSKLLDGSCTYMDVLKNKDLLQLIKERVRLDYFREINAVESQMTNKQIKQQAKLYVERLISEIKESDEDKQISATISKLFIEKIPFVRESIDRKIIALPKRIRKIIHFFRELFLVVEQTDLVIKNNGVQAWIVGHRTVLGNITVNMAEILNEWFVSMGYYKVTTLQRQYSFKRMPHHINSTITRKEEIKTMMHEHIIVVQKQTSNV